MRVLVTRPEPGAGRTARLLTARGFEPLVVPLTRIAALPVEDAVAQTGFDAVAITSASAVLHAPAALAAAWRDLPAFVVGTSTGAAAEKAGFRRVTVGPGDAAGLAALMAEALPTGASIAYPCGRVRRPDFASALRAAGLSVAEIETYDTVETPVTAQELAVTLATRPVGAVLVYSQNAAAVLARMAASDAVARCLAQVDLCCISARAAMPLAGLFPDRTRVAAHPGDAEMIALLDKAD